jgi:hypothetical protein
LICLQTSKQLERPADKQRAPKATVSFIGLLTGAFEFGSWRGIERPSHNSLWRDLRDIAFDGHGPPSLSSLTQAFPNPERIAPQIQNGIDIDHVVFHLIIDAEWESLRQHPMESKIDWMNTGKKN